MVCVDKNHQGKGIASELIRFAKEMSDKEEIPLLFDTDMKSYAEMYQHFGCNLYNAVTADNGVTRYCLVYNGDNMNT
jgi:GNAT superfamily N-acetyltransferase